MWWLLRPEHLTVDWNGWRQADTQSMALRFLEPGSSLLYPKINWGGDGPGYVESELPLYAYVAAQFMRLLGAYEGVSQALSLVLVWGAGLLLFRVLDRAWGSRAALFGLLAFLCSRSLVHCSTAVQPESMSLFLGVAAFACFMAWRERPERWGRLAAFGALGALACLSKPTAVQILVAPLWLVLREPPLRSHWRRVALTYVLIAVTGLVYLLHARSLFIEYGNTFGLLSGGDRKTPMLDHLLRPRLYLFAVQVFLGWGPTYGILATLAALLWFRRRDDVAVALLVGAAFWSLISWRYSTWSDFGSHYMIFGGLFGAWLVAALWSRWESGSKRERGVVLACTGILVAAGSLSYSVKWEYAHRDTALEPLFALGRELGTISLPGDLVIVRSTANRYDSFWRSDNNFEEPMVLYESRRRGWVLAADETSLVDVEVWWKRGARYFADPVRVDADSPIRPWLEQHGQRVITQAIGDVWQLRAPAASASLSPR